MMVFHQDLRVDCVIIFGQIMPFAPVLLAIFIHYALAFSQQIVMEKGQQNWARGGDGGS